MGKFRGIENIKQVWVCFDPRNEPLSKFVAPNILLVIANAQTMRNKMVHGSAVYKLEDCKDTAVEVLRALDDLRSKLDDRYGFDGWTPMKRRIKSALHADPRVKT